MPRLPALTDDPIASFLPGIGAALARRLRASQPTPSAGLTIDWRSVWQPQPGPQTTLIESDVTEIFYGGARYGGKTDGMLGDWMQHESLYGKDADGIFFRRKATDLGRVKKRAWDLFPLLGAVYSGFAGGHWTWPSGARLRFRHLWDEKDAASYLSESVTWVCCEELPEWPDIGVPLKLFGILRSPAGVPVKFRGTGNPLGAGHGAVKQRYVDPAPPLTPIWDEATKMNRMFIPARIEDNPAGTEKDPGYESRLYATGGPDLIRAWRWGEWDVAAGAFFSDVWDPRRQVLAASEVGPIPASWRTWRSLDWGSAKPTAVLFWAEADGATKLRNDRILPRGSLVVWGEIYTLAHDLNGQPVYNKGTGASNEDLGKDIAAESAKAGRSWNGCVADPSIFIRQGGLSIYEQMQAGAARLGLGFSFGSADNSRVPGWQLCRSLLTESAKERPEGPGFYVYDNCLHFKRTVPGIQRSTKKPEDVDTNVEDHLADAFRYGAMAAVATGAVSSELRL